MSLLNTISRVYFFTICVIVCSTYVIVYIKGPAAPLYIHDACKVDVHRNRFPSPQDNTLTHKDYYLR